MAIGTALAIGGALGAIGGVIQGAKGTPDTTSKTSFGAATPQEQDLQRQSIANFMAQQQLAQQQEGNIAQFDPLRQQALGSFQDILGGNAFNLTPQEQQNIQNLRNASIAQGTADVQRFTQEGIQAVQGAAGTRNLRGQALGGLQGQVLNEGQRQIGAITNQANQFAQQQAINLPFQRIAVQSPFLTQGLSFADELRQRAIQNRQLGQNPVALQMLQRERLAASTTTEPGQRGSIGGAILGGVRGAIGGAGAGATIFGGLQNLRGAATVASSPNQFSLGANTNFDQFKQPIPGVPEGV